MGLKHKKTRKEKIIADYRHQVYSLKNKDIPLSVSPNVGTDKNSYSYTYVLNDVLKTTLLTLSIIAIQIVLFFLLKKHIISIPNLSY